MRQKRLRISFFLRKPRVGQNFSIERLFDAIGEALPADRYEVKRLVCPFESNGVIRRLLLLLWAFLNQGDVNHVTGDIHFIGLLLRRSRTVLTIHDSAAVLRLTGLKRWLYCLIWLRLPILRAGCVTVISESTFFETLQYTKLGSHKIRIIPNCVTGGLLASTYTFNGDNPRLLQIGTKENKNLSKTIEAIKGIRCLLVIIGPLSAFQEKLLKESEITYENHVGLDNEAMAQQYGLADAVVFASTYEGFGLPILEAQTVGRPVITSARPPMDRVAGSGAVLVNPDDPEEIRNALLRTFNDATYRNELIRLGFENIKRFSPECVAAEYAAVYEQLYGDEIC
jgi:glycosyltransferase involved in cell wall biosynthesis